MGNEKFSGPCYIKWLYKIVVLIYLVSGYPVGGILKPQMVGGANLLFGQILLENEKKLAEKGWRARYGPPSRSAEG